MKCPKDMMPFVYLPPEELKPYEDVGSPPNSDSGQYRKAMQVLKLENSNLKTELENLNSYVKDLQDKFDQLSQGYKKYKVALANLQSLSILDTSPPDIPEKGFMPRSFSYESAEKSKRQ